MMREQWVIFKNAVTGEEICAYTLRGTFRGEIKATKELLSSECGIPYEDIIVSVAVRDGG